MVDSHLLDSKGNVACATYLTVYPPSTRMVVWLQSEDSTALAAASAGRGWPGFLGS